MKESNFKYYHDVANKFLNSWCDDNSFKNVVDFSSNIFNSVSLDKVAFCYIINFSLFLYNYENANKSDDHKCYYIGLKMEDLEKYVFNCKEINNMDYGDQNWNKLRFYKNIKNVITNYCDSITTSYDISKYESKNSFIEYYVECFNNYVDNGKYKSEKAYPMFDDLIGLDEAKRIVKEKIIDPILYKDIYAKYNIQVGGGILLYGLPGTGKTMFAQAVANEIDGYFVSIKSSDIKSKWYGDTETKVKELFDEARKHDTSVIFFDEFEAVGVSRDKQGAELTAETIVPELLSQMQGFEKNEKTILVIAATNRPWDIDSALLRPGRFDSLIYIELPNLELRLRMFKKNLSRILIDEDILEYLASATKNYNGADIKKICDSLVRKVINKEIEKVSNYYVTFEDCVEILKSIKSSVMMADLNNINKFKEINK